MARKLYDGTGRKLWSLAPLRISKFIPGLIAEYSFLSGEPRNQYVVNLLEADAPRLKKEVERLRKERDI